MEPITRGPVRRSVLYHLAQHVRWVFQLYPLAGTHLSNTSEAGAFTLISEEGIAKGVRRIIAYTSKKAREAIQLADSYAERIKQAEGLTGAALEKVRSSARTLYILPRCCLVRPECIAHYVAKVVRGIIIALTCNKAEVTTQLTGWYPEGIKQAEGDWRMQHWKMRAV